MTTVVGLYSFYQILSSGVSHVGVSYHSVIHGVRKFAFPKSKSTIGGVQNFKQFSDKDFYNDLLRVP